MTSLAARVDQSAMAKNGTLVCPVSGKLCDEDTAALCIQWHFRAYLSRKQLNNQEETMRLKRNIRSSHEERFLLQNHKLNQQNEDKLAALRTRSGYRVSPGGIRIQQGWNFFQTHKPPTSPPSTNTTQCGYSPTLASPLEDLSDQAMSLSSPEEVSKNSPAEDDSLSDLEYTETSPLLTTRSIKDSLQVEDDDELSEDYNNNHPHNATSPVADPEDLDSEDSMFSDSSEMSDQTGKDCYLLENTYNNNNLLENKTRDQLYIGDDKDQQLERRNREECEPNPTRDVFCCADSPVTVNECQQKVNLPDVLPVDATKSPSLGSIPGTNDVSPMSDTSCSSDLDVNIASNQTYNDFSMPNSKRSDIQCLVQDTVQPDGVNIREFSDSCLEESKILNTIELLPRNMTKEYQHQLRNRSVWNRLEEWPRLQTRDSNDTAASTEDTQKSELSEAHKQETVDLVVEEKPVNMSVGIQHTELAVDLLTGATDVEGTTVTFSDENHNAGSNSLPSLTPEDNNAIELTAKVHLGKKTTPDQLGDFDVYNIETAMPTIDWAAMEAHLARAAKEDDWLKRRRNDREEIRRKLAMDSDGEDYYLGERVTKKPSLTTRLQSGMNLQICFMNETASDQESQGSDQDVDSSVGTDKEESKSLLDDIQKIDRQTKAEEDKDQQKESCVTTPLVPSDNNLNNNNNNETTSETVASPNTKRQRPSFFFNRQRSWRLGHLRSSSLQKKEEKKELEEDFFTRHARLQAEARMALAQAKEMARMQMEVERQRKKKSPISEIVGLPFPDGKHRLSRHVLNDMNVAQLQVIVNDLHSQIEGLNEELVRLLLERDDLHMEQDSMLVDIEDLTRYLGAKDEALRNQQTNQLKKPKSTKK